MSTFLTYVLVAAVGAYVVVLAAEVFSRGFSRRWGLELAVLLAAVGVLHLATGFPRPADRQSFGAASDLGMVALMFVAILAGMAARYFFYLRGKFRWRSFLRPLCVSPIVLLPLLGTFPFGNKVELIQLISFAILAFQNGFFWRVIFERAKEAS